MLARLRTIALQAPLTTIARQPCFPGRTENWMVRSPHRPERFATRPVALPHEL